MNAPRPIEFWFDFSSPYSYIASEWSEALAARHGRTVDWKAFLLGVTFQAASAAEVLRRNLLVYGVGGLVAPFVGIKAIDLVLTAVGVG